MLGLQLERKRDTLRAKIEKQHNKDSFNFMNGNSALGNDISKNNMNINMINNHVSIEKNKENKKNKENIDISNDDIKKRIKQEFEGNMGLKLTGDALQEMVNIGMAIIANDRTEKDKRKLPNTIMNDKIDDLKKIHSCLFQKKKNNVANYKGINNNEIEIDKINAKLSNWVNPANN